MNRWKLVYTLGLLGILGVWIHRQSQRATTARGRAWWLGLRAGRQPGSGHYLGFVLATLTTGFIADRFGNRLVVWLSGLCLAAGGSGTLFASDYAWLVGCLAIAGYGLGAIELGANALMIELHSDSPGRYLNLLSVFHGCGSLVVPLVAAALLARPWNWQAIYATSALFSLPLLIVFWPVRSTDDMSSSTSANPPATP